ncbi:MAG: pyruvate kinase alpha/beta domain-containing protein [Clostridia bacterium]
MYSSQRYKCKRYNRNNHIGSPAEIIIKYKPEEPVIAATPDIKSYHQQALTRGVYPVHTK